MKSFKNFRIEPTCGYFAILVKVKFLGLFPRWEEINEVYETEAEAEAAILNKVIDRPPFEKQNYKPKFQIGQSVKFVDSDSIAKAVKFGTINSITIRSYGSETIYTYTVKALGGSGSYYDVEENNIKLC